MLLQSEKPQFNQSKRVAFDVSPPIVCPVCGNVNASEAVFGANVECHKALGEFKYLLLRYGLVLVLGWIGAMKFTAYEAEGIKSLIETSPLMSWMNP